MVEGSLWKGILFISLPLMASQVLQVLFNMADVAVVGKYSSPQALGSVGSTTTLVTLFTGLLIGLGCGVNVKAAQFLGAKRERELSESVHTALILCTAAGAVICVLCFVLAKGMLELLGTKEDLIDGAVLYFRIYAFGMPALGIFNFGNGVMSANGDTKRPLAYLTAAGILNLALNLFFVIVCGMAVEGVALASIISQYLSAGLTLARLFRLKDACGLSLSQLRIYRGRSGPILALGVPAGIQNAIFAVANLFIQAGVNTFDSVTVEGSSAAANADAIAFNVMAAFYTACSTFMGQNWGARKHKRVIQSYFISLIYSVATGLLVGLLFLFLGREFLALFTNDAGVVETGMQRLRIMAFSYAVSPFMDCTIAASRGIGKSAVPTVIVIMGSCVFRVIWVYTIFAYFRTIPSLYLIYIFSWTITAIAEIIYFAVTYRRLNRAQELEAVAAPLK